MLLRSAFIVAVSLVGLTAAAASETTRTPGAYTSLTTTNAAACARACAEDGICMAWSFYADNQCQLSAVVSQAGSGALATGYASRAPAYLQPQMPIVPVEATAQPSQPPPTVQQVVDETTPIIEPQEDNLVLLGGPGEGDLRLGLR